MNYGDFSNPEGGYIWQPSKPGPTPSINPVQSYLTTPTDPSKDKRTSYFKSLLIQGIKNIKNNTSILDRMLFFRWFYRQMRPYVPNNPAVYTVDDFINRSKLGIEPLKVSDANFNTVADSSYLYDIRRMPEIAKLIEKVRLNPKEKTIGLSRNLGIEGEPDFIMDFISDIFTNSTRALLGSFTGTATSIATGNLILINVVITNQLNWESLTRLPPFLGGYSAENTDSKSLVPLIPNLALDMEFKIRIDVNL